MKFLHISDLHIQSEDTDDNYGKDFNLRIYSLLKDIKAKYENHYLIVTGDITNDGKEDQYQIAQQYFNDFQGKVFFCPGNHDFGLQGNYYSEERARRFDNMLMMPFKQDGTFKGDQTPIVHTLRDDKAIVRLIGLDSNLETDNSLDFACGEIGATQMKFLNSILSSPTVPEMRTLLYFHHHPFMHANFVMKLRDSDDFMRMTYNKNVDIVLFGHKHESKMWEKKNGFPCFLAADNYQAKRSTREIVVDGSTVTVNELTI